MNPIELSREYALCINRFINVIRNIVTLFSCFVVRN